MKIIHQIVLWMAKKLGYEVSLYYPQIFGYGEIKHYEATLICAEVRVSDESAYNLRHFESIFEMAERGAVEQLMKCLKPHITITKYDDHRLRDKVIRASIEIALPRRTP